MSLTASYSKCSDGLYYEGPWCGDGWFICLDDDEPPELVVNLEIYPELNTKKLTVIREWLKERAPWFYPTEQNDYSGSRMFHEEFKPSKAWFGFLKGFPPPPNKHGQTRWSGVLVGNVCPNAVIQGNVYYPKLHCRCGKCRNGWLKNN